MSKLDKIKGKIAKLLALAASTSSTHERDSATAKAMAYMTEYRLSMGDIERINLKQEGFNHTGIKISKGDSVMATVIAKALGVHVSFRQGHSIIKGVFFYVGEPSDIEFARYVFEVASAQIIKKAKSHRLSLGGAPTKYMNGYRNGLKFGFAMSFAESHKAGCATGSSDNTGLMALNNRYSLACEHAGVDFSADKRKAKPSSGMLNGLNDSKDISVNRAVSDESEKPKELTFSR